MNPEVTYGLWVVVMCQCGIILGIKGTSPANGVDNVGGYARVKQEPVGNVCTFLLISL